MSPSIQRAGDKNKLKDKDKDKDKKSLLFEFLTTIMKLK